MTEVAGCHAVLPTKVDGWCDVAIAGAIAVVPMKELVGPTDAGAIAVKELVGPTTAGTIAVVPMNEPVGPTDVAGTVAPGGASKVVVCGCMYDELVPCMPCAPAPRPAAPAP